MNNGQVIYNNSSELKWITVNIDGWEMKAREDMVSQSGNNLTIVANKDYKENGLITPIIITRPKTEYVTIETQYGQLNVTQETYKRMGKDKIITKYNEMMKLKNGPINKDIQIYNSSNMLYRNASSDNALETVNILQYHDIPYIERSYFKRINNMHIRFYYMV